jgi:small-conductance mechanosensitive channel
MVDVSTVTDTVASVLDEFVRGVIASLPKLLSAGLFLVLAYLFIKAILWVVRSVLSGVYPEDQKLVVDLLVAVVGLFLWFGAALTLLDIVGMGEIAASLGTATGFIALGVSYALSNVLADVVAGVYLLRDRDFNVGDEVTTGSTTGVVENIGLRKSRIETAEGDVVVVANRTVDAGWTLES